MVTLKSTEIKIVGAFLLVSGLFGFFAFILTIFPLNNFVAFFNIVPTFLFALTFYSGYLLLIKQDEKGIEYARAVVALQLINFHIYGVGYMFITGAFIFIGFNNLNFGFDVGLNTTFVINLSEETNNFLFRVNILALAVFIYLSRLMNRIEEEEEKKELKESI